MFWELISRPRYFSVFRGYLLYCIPRTYLNIYDYKRSIWKKQFCHVSGVSYDTLSFSYQLCSKLLYLNLAFHISVLESQEHAPILNSVNINKTHHTRSINEFGLVEFPKYSVWDFWYEIAISCGSTFRYIVV